MAKQIRCPKCKSFNFVVLDNSKKSVSAGKALVGGVVAGPVGAIVGGAMGKKGKLDLVCQNCGWRWQQKK